MSAPSQPASIPRELALPNADFEADFPQGSNCALGWGCVMHADPHSFRFFLDETAPSRGKRSFCIEPITKEPWGKAVVALVDRSWRGARVRFSLSVRAEGVTGPGGGPFIAAHGGSGQVLELRQRHVSGSAGWQRVAVELDVPASAVVLEVGAFLEGAGRVCVDDARLEILQVPKTPV